MKKKPSKVSKLTLVGLKGKTISDVSFAADADLRFAFTDGTVISVRTKYHGFEDYSIDVFLVTQKERTVVDEVLEVISE